MKRLILLATTTFVMNSTMAANANWWNLQPYVGADIQMRRMDFKGGFGDNLFQHHSPQGNIYAGTKLDKNIGLELGFEATTTRTRTATLNAGDVLAGAPLNAAVTPCVLKSKAKLKGPHLDVVGFYTFDERYPLQLLGSVGVSVLKSTFERRTIQLPAPMVAKTNRTMGKTKAVLRLAGGLQHMFSDHIGMRLTVNWVRTSQIVAKANDGIVPDAMIKPKNSTVYGLGALWVF